MYNERGRKTRKLWRDLQGSLRPSWFIKDCNVAAELEKVRGLEADLSKTGTLNKAEIATYNQVVTVYIKKRGEKMGDKFVIDPYGGVGTHQNTWDVKQSA